MSKACAGGSGSYLSNVVAGGGGGDGDGGRQKGTTLGYVKSTWAELVARCERSGMDSGGSGTGSGRDCFRIWSHVQRASW